MVKRCGVPGCCRYANENYSVYNLPKDPARRKRWIEILNIEEENVSDNLRVCGRHFQPEYAKCRRLSENVLPQVVQAEAGCSSAASVIVLDESPTKRRSYPPFVRSNQQLSQASSKSVGSNKDSSVSCESPISESFRERFFTGPDLSQPKKDYLPKNNERNFIVNENQLRLLLCHCPKCGEKCGEALAKNYGIDTEFFIDCKHCEEVVSWSTQPEIPSCDLKRGNLDTTAGVVLSGNTYETLKAISSNLRLQVLAEHTFYRYANEYVYPAVDHAFLYQQQLLLESIQQQQADGHSLSLGVDCRFSRPGYTATYGVTSAMCLASEKIVATVVKSKTDTDVTSSAEMEVAGTRTLLKAIMQPYAEEDEYEAVNTNSEPGPGTIATNAESDSPEFNLPAPESIVPLIPLSVGLLVTDENQAVMSMVRREFPELDHQADPWHLRKCIMKYFSKAAKKKANAPLGPWIPSIRKWLWTSMKECEGNADKLIELWRSLRYHVIGQHSWEKDASHKIYRSCAHGDLSHRNIAFLPPEADAYKALVEIVEIVPRSNKQAVWKASTRCCASTCLSTYDLLAESSKQECTWLCLIGMKTLNDLITQMQTASLELHMNIQLLLVNGAQRSGVLKEARIGVQTL